MNMIIKRDILGTIVNIELTEQEMKEVHIAYLKSELSKVLEEPKRITKKDEIMPEHEAPYMVRLRECSARLRGSKSSIVRGRIIDQYLSDMMDAMSHGMNNKQISIAMGVCDKVVHERLNREIMLRTLKSA